MRTVVTRRLLLLLLLVLLVVCIGGDVHNNNHDTTTSTQWHVVEAKQLGVHAPWPAVIADAMLCDVCEHALVNAYMQLAHLARARQARQLRVGEDDVLDVLERLCVPYGDGGEWVRRVALHVQEEEQQQQTKKDTNDTLPPPRHRLVTRVLDEFAACKRTCATVAQLCSDVLDSAAADVLPHELLKAVHNMTATTAAHATMNEGNKDDEERIAVIARRVCGVTAACRQRRTLRAAAARALVAATAQTDAHNASPHATATATATAATTTTVSIDELVADTAERSTPQDREVERMMHTMKTEQGRDAQVLSRAEMRALQQAVLRGDRDAVAALDASLAHLTDDEFAQIRELTAREGWFASSDDGDDGNENDDEMMVSPQQVDGAVAAGVDAGSTLRSRLAVHDDIDMDDVDDDL